MRIASIGTHLISTPIPPGARVQSGAGLKLSRQMCLVTVRTEDGSEGFGSPSGPYDLGLLDRVICHVIGPALIGRDARDIERVWHDIYSRELHRNVGNRGLGIAALSAIDMALWDLKARMANMPLYELLGGRYHENGVRAYASSIYWDLTPDEAARQACDLVSAGYSAVKLKVGREPRQDRARVSAIRAAVGYEVDLLVDANQSLSRMDAMALLPALEDAGVYWFEEPLSVDDIEGHRMLREARRSVRIATGENLYTRFGVMEFVTAGAVDVIQADASRVGGISEAKRIAAVASAHHLEWNPHTFNDLFTVAANLHLVVATEAPPMFEWDITYNPLMEAVASPPLTVKNGRVFPSDGPGLGLEIDWEFVNGHPWSGEAGIGPGYGPRSRTDGSV